MKTNHEKHANRQVVATGRSPLHMKHRLLTLPVLSLVILLASKAPREFVMKWRKLAPKVVVSLEEAGEELLTFYRFPKSQWKSLRTTNVIERLNGEFRRRVKTQGSLPDAKAAELLLFGLLISGQIHMRRIDGGRDLKQFSVLKNGMRGDSSTVAA